MKTIKKFIDGIPCFKVVIFLVVLGVVQFAIINLKDWRAHPTDQPLHQFILGRWVAINIKSTDNSDIPIEIDFINSQDVYFEREFPEIYESMERDYKLNGDRIELSPPTRSLSDWIVSRAGEELKIGDVTYRRAINFPWRTIALIFLVCVLWGMMFSANFEISRKDYPSESAINSPLPKWANFAGYILIPLLGWIGFQIGLWAYRKIVALHWREPWISIYLLELLVLAGVFSIKIFKLNWKLRVPDIALTPMVAIGFLAMVIIASGVLLFSLRWYLG